MPHRLAPHPKYGLGASHPHFANYVHACTCDRDARVADLVSRMIEATVAHYLSTPAQALDAALAVKDGEK